MKKNNKGFTMVELLAVIVILGVLGTIGVTATMKYLTESREKSYRMMSQTLYEATMNCMIQGKCSTPTKNMPVEYTSAKLVELGYVDTMKNPKSSSADCVGTVKVINVSDSSNNTDYQKYTYAVQLKCEGVADTTIMWPEAKTDGSIENLTKYSNNVVDIEKTYNVGETIKYNPYTGLSCETGDLCYTWYVIKKSTSTDKTLTLLLNKNIGEKVELLSQDNYLGNKMIADTANNYLAQLTSSWKYKGRLITKQEILGIIGQNDVSGHFSLDNYKWLAATTYAEAYWIDSFMGTTLMAWAVNDTTIFSNNYTYSKGNAQKKYVRPVIEIIKNN